MRKTANNAIIMQARLIHYAFCGKLWSSQRHLSTNNAGKQNEGGNRPVERRMAAISVVFATGIAASEYASLALCITIGCAALFLCFTLKTRLRTTLALLALIFLLGADSNSISLEIASNDVSRLSRRVASFEGIVASDPDIEAHETRVCVSVRRINSGARWRKAGGSVMVSIHAKPNDRQAMPDSSMVRASESTLPLILLKTQATQASFHGKLTCPGRAYARAHL